ncbi:MAG: guanylate kinase [Eubacteriaceae bacterium]|nr:guanylate kinase [Eubacteriaceae bacterium]MBR5995658.1 guanylate kinase [Eubacteriaceae bacterium]
MSNLFVVSGPSGSGKSTICALAAEKDSRLRISISATTRSPRGEEQDGKEYFFLSDEEFDEKLAAGEFYEHADIFGKRYGTLRPYVDRLIADGFDVILEIDYQGAYQIKDQNEKAVLVFIMPPSFEELSARLRARSTETEEQLEIRLAKAEAEMKESVNYDRIIINDRLDEAVDEFLSYIAEKREKAEEIRDE